MFIENNKNCKADLSAFSISFPITIFPFSRKSANQQSMFLSIALLNIVLSGFNKFLDLCSVFCDLKLFQINQFILILINAHIIFLTKP